MKPHRQMKQRRRKIGLTQWQVARKIGFTRSGYANLENGYRRLRPHHLQRIGRVLHMRFM